MAAKIFPAILIAVVVWLGAQVWHASSEGLRQESQPAAAKKALVPASARPAAMDFTLTSLDGAPVQLASFRGKAPVVLNFGATWCPGCREELPHLAELYRKQRDAGLQVFLVSDEPAERLRPFAESLQLPFPVLSDPQRRVHDSYGVNSIPFTLVIDREGKIVTGHTGYSYSQFFEQLVPEVEDILKQ
jgi:peroxiredoxin